MKKILLWMLMLLMLFACVACSSGNDEGNDTQGSVPDQTQGADAGAQDTSTPDDELKLEGFTRVGSRSIKVYYDDHHRRKDIGNDTLVFHSDPSNVIVLAYDKSSAYTDSVDGVFDILNDGDVFASVHLFTSSAFADTKPFIIEPVSTEKVTGAGFESVRVIGTVTDANGKEAAVYAYTFVIDETPCMLAGIIIDDANNPDIADAVRKEVDLMAQSIQEA